MSRLWMARGPIAAALYVAACFAVICWVLYDDVSHAVALVVGGAVGAVLVLFLVVVVPDEWRSG